MADEHFEIAKKTDHQITRTQIRLLNEEDSALEIARTSWWCADYGTHDGKCKRDERTGTKEKGRDIKEKTKETKETKGRWNTTWRDP